MVACTYDVTDACSGFALSLHWSVDNRALYRACVLPRGSPMLCGQRSLTNETTARRFGERVSSISQLRAIFDGTARIRVFRCFAIPSPEAYTSEATLKPAPTRRFGLAPSVFVQEGIRFSFSCSGLLTCAHGISAKKRLLQRAGCYVLRAANCEFFRTVVAVD